MANFTKVKKKRERKYLDLKNGEVSVANHETAAGDGLCSERRGGARGVKGYEEVARVTFTYRWSKVIAGRGAFEEPEDLYLEKGRRTFERLDSTDTIQLKVKYPVQELT